MGIIEKLKEKLEGGKFRLLNEKIYQNKELTEKEVQEYQRCYQKQIKKWPSDPKTDIIKKIEESEQSEMRIADLGSGSCEVAEKLPNVTSFDKYPANEKVIKCDLKKLLAEDGTFDVAICCLSLMMANATGVVKEVNRILKVGGSFYLAELTSRIGNTRKFIHSVEKLGFKVKDVDKNNAYFVILKFEKVHTIDCSKKLPAVMLGEWAYKKR